MFMANLVHRFHHHHIANHLLSPLGGLYISSPFEGGGGRTEGGIFILEKTMVLLEELEYEVEKLK